MQLNVSLEGKNFLVDDGRPMTLVGRGKTLREALGDYIIHNQEYQSVEIIMDKKSEKKNEENTKTTEKTYTNWKRRSLRRAEIQVTPPRARHILWWHRLRRSGLGAGKTW